MKDMKKNKKTTAKSKKGGKFSVLNELHEGIMNLTTVGKNGAIKLKRSELKNTIEQTFAQAAKLAASGQRIRFPVIGVMASRQVKARKAGKGVNPFTGEEMMIKARPESKKPRWSFPKAVKETFANKKNW